MTVDPASGESTVWKSRLGSAAFVAGGFSALSSWWVASWILLALGVVLLWAVPGWWRAMLYGAIGGLVSGLLVLAPGFRLAMRVVAILDPVRSTEFTMDGTLFVFLSVGGLLGLVVGVLGAVGRVGWSITLVRAWVLPAMLVMLLLMEEDELRDELFGLGAGPWVNIPMFALVAAAYGWLAMRVVARLESRRKASYPAASTSGSRGRGFVG